MKDHLRITSRSKGVTFHFQIWSQIKKVIEFSIIDDAACFIFVPDWLLAPHHVYDAEPAYPKFNISILIEPLLIWTSMMNGIAHQAQEARLSDLPDILIIDSANSTHLFSVLHTLDLLALQISEDIPTRLTKRQGSHERELGQALKDL
jgi:hypothetical protein